MPPVILGEASEETAGWICRVDPDLGARCVSLDPCSPHVLPQWFDRWTAMAEESPSWMLPYYEGLHCDWPRRQP